MQACLKIIDRASIADTRAGTERLSREFAPKAEKCFRHAQLEPDQDRRDRDRLIKLLSPSERAILHGMDAAVRMPRAEGLRVEGERTRG